MENKKIKLDEIRSKLVQLEDAIIVSLFDRSQYALNEIIYTIKGPGVPHSNSTFFDFLFEGTERLHASAGRYLDHEERPFFANTPKESLIERESIITGVTKELDYTKKVRDLYFDNLPKICKGGDDGAYGRAAIADIEALQRISRRVHMGEQVAEAKYQENPSLYSGLIDRRDVKGILNNLTNLTVEENIYNRVFKKGERYGINPRFIANFFKEQLIPLTKDIEIEYFLGRNEK